MPEQHHPHHQDHHQSASAAHSPGYDDTAMAELLDLDAEVLRSYLGEVTAWIGELTAARAPRRMLDLGSGTGAGAFALLERFAAAHVTAVDLSESNLRRLAEKSVTRGWESRVEVVQADLDATWPAVGVIDLVWASSSLHHLAHPDRVLDEVCAALRPGGLAVIAELNSFPRFLPDDIGIGRPGLEARCHATLAAWTAAEVPLMGADWGSYLSRAGLCLEAERRFVIDLTAPLPPSTGRYAQASLRRLRAGLDGQMNAEDLAVLDVLLDSDGPEGLIQRNDLSVRAVRQVWVGRKPSAAEKG